MDYAGDMTESAEERRLARKRRRHARAREELVDAARTILTRDGVKGFTVKAVAAEADVSKPAFYYYFDSREHLIAELADRVLAREAAALVEAAYRAESPPQAAGEVLRTRVRFYTEDLEAFRVVYLWPLVIGTPDGFSEQVVEPRRQQVHAVLAQRLRDAPGAPDADAMASVVLATATGLLTSDHPPADRMRLARLAADTLERALAHA